MSASLQALLACSWRLAPASFGDRHSPLPLLRRLRGRYAFRGEHELGGGTFAKLTPQVQSPTVHLDHRLDESETQARSFLLPAQGRFGLNERFEHAVKVALGDADSVVLHRDDKAARIQTGGDFYLAARG